MQTLEIRNFGGGIVDSVIGSGESRMVNLTNVELYPTDQGLKIKQRGGLAESGAGQLPTGNQTISRLMLVGEDPYVGGPNLIAMSSRRLFHYHSLTEVWNNVNDRDGNYAFSSSLSTASTMSFITDTDHVYVTGYVGTWGTDRENLVVYNPESYEWYAVPHTIPKPTISLNTSSGAGSNWVYKAVLRWAYTAQSLIASESKTFEVLGPVSATVSVTGKSSATINIPALPAKFGTADAVEGTMYLDLYRTTHNGTVYYLVTSITLTGSTQTYADSALDATIQANAVLFTDTGEMDNADIAPATASEIKGTTIYNDRMYALYSTDLVYQSKAGSFRMFGDTAYTSFNEETYAIATTPNGVVVITETGVHRIDGVIEDTGDGNMSISFIGKSDNPYTHNSVVATSDGAYWLSSSGIWFTDGLSVRYLSKFNKTYITSAYSGASGEHIHGVFSPLEERVYWVVSANAGISSTILVLDLRYSSGDTVNVYKWYRYNRADTSLAVNQVGTDYLAVTDTHGYIYVKTDILTVDSQYSSTVSRANWGTREIFYTVETPQYDFGSLSSRKYIPSVTATLDVQSSTYQNFSNIKLGMAMYHTYDNNSNGSLKDVIIGTGKSGIHTVKRHIPARKLRCYTKGLKLSPAQVALYTSSDTLYNTTCSINATTKVATLTDTATYDWPGDLVDHYISFETDSYAREYQITARTNDTVTYSDAGNNSVTGSAKGWVIRGYQKGDNFKLLGLSLNYDINGTTADPYNSADNKDLG